MPASLVNGQSDIGAVLSFAFANSLSGSEALQFAYGKRGEAPPEFLALSQTSTALRRGSFREMPPELCARHLRFCPACAECGYLPSAFAFVWLAVCPAHGMQLLTCCVSCGALCEYVDLFRSAPFVCARCKRPWFGARPQLNDVEALAASKRIEPEWLRIKQSCTELGWHGNENDRRYVRSDIYGERAWRLIGSAARLMPSPNWHAYALSPDEHREFEVKQCFRPYRTPELQPKLSLVVDRLIGDVYSELPHDTLEEIERILDIAARMPLSVSTSTPASSLAMGVAVWRRNLGTFCERNLLHRQDGLLCGVPMRDETKYPFVVEASWRSALLASLYACCEAATVERHEQSRLFEINSDEILLPRRGNSYFTWKGRFTALDRISLKERKNSNRRSLLRETKRRWAERQTHSLMSSPAANLLSKYR